MTKTQETGSRAYLFSIVLVAIIGGLLFGYDTAVVSGAEQALDQFFHTFLENPPSQVRISLKSIGQRPCSQVDQNPLVRRITAIRKQHGLSTTCIAGSTDANIPLSLGIPAISFGFCRSRREHTLEESLDIDTFIPGMMQMLAFMGL